MKDKKLNTKDLVSIGIFTVIYFVVYFSVGMMGVVPVLYLVFPSVFSLVAGMIVMPFMAKVQKPLALLIFGMLPPLIMFFMGHTIFFPLTALISVGLAEIIRAIGGYSSMKASMLSYAVFNTYPCAVFSQMFFARETYLKMCEMMGGEYGPALEKILTVRNLVFVYLGSFVCGLIGSVIAKNVLKKHFKKANLN